MQINTTINVNPKSIMTFVADLVNSRARIETYERFTIESILMHPKFYDALAEFSYNRMHEGKTMFLYHDRKEFMGITVLRSYDIDESEVKLIIK